MIITIVMVIIDWIILHLNDQLILRNHSLYIGFLVIVLWFHQQPQSYRIDQQAIKQLRKSNVEIGQEKISNKCQICNAIKPSRYYHCRRCNKCIYRMDHHCHWVGNCIGQYNSKVYLHLLVNIFLHSLALIFVFVTSYSTLFDSYRYQIYYFVSIFPALYACYQSYRLINDFFDSVKRNQTLIQSYKKVMGKKITFEQSFISYMGKNKIGWFLPYFQSNKNCDVLQITLNEPNEQVKECIYADEYMDGSDEQFDEQLLKQG